METKLTIKTNADNFQAFENETQVGQLDFEIDGRTMVIPHTVVFDGNEGKGIGKALVKAAVAYAEAHQLTVKIQSAPLPKPLSTDKMVRKCPHPLAD